MKLSFRSIAITILFAGIAFIANAQVIKIDSLSPWRKYFKAGLNLNQAAFSSNWKAGGVNSFGFNTLLNFKPEYKKDKNSWSSEIDLVYGMINNQGQGYRKTVDRVFLDTKYGRQLNAKWDFTTGVNLLTQFAPGYNYTTDPVTNEVVETLISDIFAPAFITAGIGFEYHPVEYFKVRISPFAPRITIVNGVERFVTVDNPTPFGVTPPETVRYELLAAQILAEFNKDIAKNINLKWTYMMFVNYETLEARTIDHRLDLTVTGRVNQFVNVSVGGIILYDYDQDLGVQLNQVFSLGVAYSFQNYKDK
jgi:hypothetical protein